MLFIRTPLLLALALFSLVAMGQQTTVVYLSGIDKDHTVPWDFYLTEGRNSGVWTTIPVPSNWELQGFGVYNYGQRNQPEKNQRATYRTAFAAAPAWKGKRINLVFEGVMTDTEVWVNGKLAGPVHQGSFYRFKYDITALVKPGRQNQLEVRVKNWSDNASVNTAEREADYWVFGGIYRPVYLEILPQSHIQWTAIDARHTGAFRMKLYSRAFGMANGVEAEVQTLDGTPVGELLYGYRGLDTTISLKGQFEGIKPWSAEFPNRYQVVVRLMKGDEVLHEIREKFGFRTVELRERDGFYVNGVKILFKGVNRHSFWPESGRTTSRELSEMDVNLMKDMNMNAVRMSHYPPDKHFLEVCDSLGLYVLDELAGWQTMYDSVVAKKLVKEMLVRDVNHPCIVIWDNGNEGGGNHAVDDEFHRYDLQRRPLIHPWKKFRGTDTQHYRPYDCCTGGLYHGRDVFFPTEFLHGLYDGGHGAGLEDHWKLMRSNPLSAGGFLWSFSDEAVVRRDLRDSLDGFGANAPDGIVGPYREKEGSFYAIREIWCPVHIPDFSITPHFTGQVPLENHYHFTDLNRLTFRVVYGKFPTPDEPGSGIAIVRLDQQDGPAVPPQGSGFLPILPGQELMAGGYDVVLITAVDVSGREIMNRTIPVKRPADLSPPERVTPVSAVTFEAADGALLFQAGATQIAIDAATGLLAGVAHNGKTFSLKNGPLPVFSTMKADTVYVSRQGDTLLVRARAGATRSQPFLDWTWTITPDGRIGLTYSYLPTQGRHDVLGIGFSYPESLVEGVRYLGQGPYRVWKNRMRGGQLAVWEKAYNHTVTGENWDYPEFKGFYADLYWVELRTTEGAIRIFSETEDLFLHLFTPAKPQGAFNTYTDGIFPATDLSFLHAISPIGTKFTKSADEGPMGAQNMFYYIGHDPKPLEIRLWLEFGE